MACCLQSSYPVMVENSVFSWAWYKDGSRWGMTYRSRRRRVVVLGLFLSKTVWGWCFRLFTETSSNVKLLPLEISAHNVILSMNGYFNQRVQNKLSLLFISVSDEDIKYGTTKSYITTSHICKYSSTEDSCVCTLWAPLQYIWYSLCLVN